MPSSLSTSKLLGATGLAAQMMGIWAIRIRVGAVGGRVTRLNSLESKSIVPAPDSPATPE